jgi:23S rRNA (cytidine1920-2'-O)/16S rRNA (cytidine1409-2'-O)-methyltransferase
MATIRLDALVAKQFDLSHEKANGLIMAGRIYIGHVPADKPGEPVSPDTILTMRGKSRKFASRSGYKLEKAINTFHVQTENLTVCDIGASNGGFTDCLLQNGAAHIYSVDVAYGILAWELRQDERVTVLERTNARHLTVEQLGELCDMVTADVSFISLKKIFPAINRILKPNGRFVSLIKPQFEASSRQVGKNGILKNPDDLPELLLSLAQSAADNALYLSNLTVSPIHGTNGNVEYLADFSRTPLMEEEQWKTLVDQVVQEKPDI